MNSTHTYHTYFTMWVKSVIKDLHKMLQVGQCMFQNACQLFPKQCFVMQCNLFWLSIIHIAPSDEINLSPQFNLGCETDYIFVWL